MIQLLKDRQESCLNVSEVNDPARLRPNWSTDVNHDAI